MNGLLHIKNYRHLLALLPQLPKVGRLCWRLWRDRRVPRSLKGMIVAVMIYVVSPIDLVPGFFMPVLGQLDDATLLMLGAYLFIRWSPPEVDPAVPTAGHEGFPVGRKRHVVKGLRSPIYRRHLPIRRQTP